MLVQPLLKKYPKKLFYRSVLLYLVVKHHSELWVSFLPLVMEVGEETMNSSATGVFPGWSVFWKACRQRGRDLEVTMLLALSFPAHSVESLVGAQGT